MFKYFHPDTFEKGRESVVGSCNGMTMEERWEGERPFGSAIADLLGAEGGGVLDYGCGVGRIAKEVLTRDDVFVVGFDTSDTQIAHAVKYVNNSLFVGTSDFSVVEKAAPFDLVYCIYVLQHVKAIDLREVIERLFKSLKPGGILVHCSSEVRMAVVDQEDQQGFFDDRFLGVDLEAELEKYFERVSDLFSVDFLEDNDVIRKMVKGAPGGIAHPATVFRRPV